MVVALTVTPALALILLRKAPIERRESPLVRWLQRGYAALLARIVPRPGYAYGPSSRSSLAGVVLGRCWGRTCFPAFKERDFLMHWVAQPGTSHAEMVRITIQASKELRAIPGVRNFGAHIGQGTLADEVVGMNFAENWISIDPDVDYDKTLAAVQEVVDGYPGLYRDVQTYLKERIEGGADRRRRSHRGPHLRRRSRCAAREGRGGQGRRVDGVDGLVDLHVTLQIEVPQIKVEVDLATASGYGIKPGDVRRAAAAFIAGEEAGDICGTARPTRSRSGAQPEMRNSVDSVRKLLDRHAGSASGCRLATSRTSRSCRRRT